MEDAAAHPEVGQLYTVARAVLNPLRKFFFKIHLDGIEGVPPSGPAIMCPNHISFLDSAFLGLVLPRRITFVGKAEYLDDWKTKWLFPALGMIPIDRGGGSASERALNAAARVLERGELFGIFPEGTRSRDGRLYKGHTGPARLALRTGAPLVPVGIVGTERIQPPDANLPKLFMHCEMKFAKPISVERYRDRVDDRLLLRQLTDEVLYEIREMTGQTYVDTYATKKAEGLPTETAVIPTANGQAAEADPAAKRSSADVLNRSGTPTNPH